MSFANQPINQSTRRRAALPTIGLTEPEDARVVRIRNTLELGEVEISEAYVAEVQSRDDLTPQEAPREMAFDFSGNLEPLHAAALQAVTSVQS